MKDNLYIIHEGVCQYDQEIKQAFVNAKRIFFLGFGYAIENLEILGIQKFLTEDKQAYGTAYGFTEREIWEKRTYLNKNYKIKDLRYSNPQIVDMNCFDLLRNYL